MEILSLLQSMFWVEHFHLMDFIRPELCVNGEML
jgi:hypothetical protein